MTRRERDLLTLLARLLRAGHLSQSFYFSARGLLSPEEANTITFEAGSILDDYLYPSGEKP